MPGLGSAFGSPTRRRLLAAAVVALATAATAGTVAAQEPAPIASAMGQVARQIYELRPVPLRIDVPPFRTIDNGMGDCDEELRDRLIDALRIEQVDPVNSVVDRRIDIRLPLARLDGSDAAARIQGRYGADASGAVWAEVQVVGSDQSALATLPRTNVVGLVCRGVTRSLADTIDFAVRGGRGSGLNVALTRPDPRVGDLVAITIQNSGRDAENILCLNLAATDTAQVLTPLRPSSPRLPQRGMLVWPRDFAASGGPAGPLCFEREQADALLCLALPGDPPPAIEKRWRAAWPEGSDEPVELPAAATVELVGEALATPGASAGFLRYRVRRGPRIH